MTEVQCQALTSHPVATPLAGQGFGGSVIRLPLSLVNLLLLWQERAAQRRHLASLDDHMLRDMGLSRADAAREASRPFWRAS